MKGASRKYFIVSEAKDNVDVIRGCTDWARAGSAPGSPPGAQAACLVVDEVSTESGSDRVAIGVNMKLREGFTRSLPLPVLTS